jgi:hypothetical protein
MQVPFGVPAVFLPPLPQDTPMPDQTVNVSFDPNANPQFTFDRQSVKMTAAGKVILLQNPASAPWTFTNAAVKGDTLNEFSPAVQGNGNSLQIGDAFLDRTETSYSYDVTVELNGVSYTSPDPQIVNDPGAGVDD